MKNFIKENFKDKRIRDRLLFLYKEGLEDEEDHPMRKESLKALSFFVNFGLKLDRFNIVLGPNGYIGIGWNKSNDKLLYISFENMKEVHFTMYKPKKSPKHKLDKYRFGKIVPIETIVNEVWAFWNNCVLKDVELNEDCEFFKYQLIYK